jgi:cytochrome c oxidase assembly protein subunit 15
MNWFHRINSLALLLCFVVVVFGAFVRLSNAGLGCPDWPGCYGHLAVPDAPHELASAEQNFPQRPVEAPKAWKEMIHRYLAGSVGTLIALMAFLAAHDRSGRLPRRLAFSTAGVVVAQIVFGALTVTMKVNPLIVTTHLLLGLLTLSLVWLMWLRGRAAEAAPARSPRNEREAWTAMAPPTAAAAPSGVRFLAALALAVLAAQIFLGGWTSTNYAAVACPDFPTCQGSYLPRTDIAEAFTLWHGADIDYEFGILDSAGRATIHLMHRYGAVVVAFTLGGIALYLLSRSKTALWRRLGIALLAALLLQLCIGVGIIEMRFPLWLADAHNAGAAVLLLTVIALNFFAWRDTRV